MEEILDVPAVLLALAVLKLYHPELCLTHLPAEENGTRFYTSLNM